MCERASAIPVVAYLCSGRRWSATCTSSINLCAISPRLGCILYTFILIKTLMAAKQMHRWWICRSFGNARCVYSVYFWIQRSICLFLTGGTPLLSLVPPLGLCVSVWLDSQRLTQNTDLIARAASREWFTTHAIGLWVSWAACAIKC